jgi:hypothetical protein
MLVTLTVLVVAIELVAAGITAVRGLVHRWQHHHGRHTPAARPSAA